LLLPTGTLKPGSAHGRVIHERETTYQYARVVESDQGLRRLELNEGLAVHSVYEPGEVLNGGWWDEFLVLPTMLTGQVPRSIAVLGNAAGTTARSYGQLFPRTEVVGVELDGELSDVGRRFFDLGGPRLQLVTADARPYLLETDRRFDAIFLDAYRQPYVPFYLATREFFELVKDRLTPDGIVLVNVGHPENSVQLERVMSATVGEVFGPVFRDPVARRNTLLVAGNAPLDLAGAGLSKLPDVLEQTGEQALTLLRPALEGGEIYTDDRAPVEWLIDKSILSYAQEAE
jgi:spermidine synthase